VRLRTTRQDPVVERTVGTDAPRPRRVRHTAGEMPAAFITAVVRGGRRAPAERFVTGLCHQSPKSTGIRAASNSGTTSVAGNERPRPGRHLPA
jgi:hypothetical protein